MATVRRSVAIGSLSIAFGLAVGLALQRSLPLALALIAPISVIATMAVIARRVRQPRDAGSVPVGLLVTSWLLIMLVNNHRVSLGGAGHYGAQTAASVVMEFAAYGTLAVAVFLDRGRWSIRGSNPVWLALFIFPIWTISSLAWGSDLVTPLVRCVELFLLAILTNVTILRARADDRFVETFLAAMLRSFTRVIVALTIAGFVFGPLWAQVDIDNRGRFTWIAAHPDAAGLFLAPAVVMLAFAPRRVLRMPLAVRLACLGLTTTALIQNHVRTAVLAVLLASLAGIWLWGRIKPTVRMLGPPYLLGAIAVTVAYAYRDVVKYALRGESTHQFLTLNTRTQLWSLAAQHLGSIDRWIIGLGYGAVRTVFLDQVAFAGNAHNSALALIVGEGVIGLLIVVAYLVWALVGLWRSLLRERPGLGIPLILVLLTVIVEATTSDALADPNFGLVVLYLCIAMAVGSRLRAPAQETGLRRRRRVAEEGGPPVSALTS